MTNSEKIKEVYRLNQELQTFLTQESDNYKMALDNKDEKLKIKRNDKEIEATEGDLWEEVRALGLTANQAVEVLKPKYPLVFEFAQKREEKNQELQNFVLKEFGFNFRAMTIADYIKLTEAVIDSKLGK